MPRRRRIRNQKRRTVGGDRGGAERTGADGRQSPLAEAGCEQAPWPPQGLPGDVLTVAILNDNLQTTRARRAEGQKREVEGGAADGERTSEIAGRINTLMNAVLMATPPLSARLDLPEPEPNVLNNMTPKRNVRCARNESYIDNLCTNSSTSLLKPNRTYKFRSNSSVSKLRSPGTEKIPITIDASTQTAGFAERERKMFKQESLHLESCINIFETPKVSQTDLLRPTPANARRRVELDKLDFKPLNLNKIRYKKLKNFSEILFGENELKALSDAEISFQNLIDARDVSTPIERRKVENVSTPQNHRNLNNKNSIVNNLSKEKVKVKKFEAVSLITKRRYKTISPRKNREIAIRNLPSSCELKKKVEKPSIPKSFTPPRASHCKTTENILNVSAEPSRFVARAKKFHTRFVARWIAKISEICNWLGLSLKKTLAPLTTAAYKPKLNIVLRQQPALLNVSVTKGNHHPNQCNCCDDYRMKLIVLSSKVEVLERELNKSTAESRKTVSSLLEEIVKIKSELSEIDVIKRQLKEIEETVRNKPAPIVHLAPPPPPPPPCAPPLPPPLPPSLCTLDLDTPVSRPKSGGEGVKRLERKPNENSRPIISLDDILKVKLKKTTDKPLSARRAQQPLISVEMLNQIKLRPTSRPETPCGFKEALPGGGAMPGSPASSLSKILSGVDTNVRRVKRLRRSNGYSLDDFSRRRVLKREWCGSDDT